VRRSVQCEDALCGSGPANGDAVTLHLWAGFVLASIVVLVIPGPTILTMTSYVMTSERGVRTLLVAAVALGDTTALTVSLVGIGALPATSASWFGVVKWAGALYLVYLGASMFRGRAMGRAPNDVAVDRSRLFGKMYAVTALNPKGVVFYVGFLPQFVCCKS
jgi:threonine/homoserine/homoserine lactone efflux protein